MTSTAADRPEFGSKRGSPYSFRSPTNVPGKSLEAVTVSYPPGAKSGAHHHAKSAFIMAYVISGALRSQA